MNIPVCPQTENQNNFRLLKMTRDIEYLQYHSRYSTQNFKRNVASYTPTGTVPEMNI